MFLGARHLVSHFPCFLVSATYVMANQSTCYMLTLSLYSFSLSVVSPSPYLSSSQVFYRMGFNDAEIVALLCGGHVYGRCHPTASGYAGPWVEEPTKFSNE